MVADKLAEARLHSGQKVLIHIEIQAQRDATLPRRMYDYHSRISEAYGLPVASLALLADEHPQWRPQGFRQQLGDTIAEFSFGSAKLLDFVTDTQALEASRNPTAWVSLAHFRSQQAHHDAEERYAAKLHLTRLLFNHRWSQRRIIVLFNAINWMMALPAPHERRYGRAIDRLEKEHGMKKLYNSFEQMLVNDGIKIGQKRGLQEGLEQGIEKGIEKGIKQGVEQGRKEGAAALLERMLVQRFGPLPQTASRKLAKASLEQLEAWSDALTEAQSLKQVFR